MTKLIKWEHRPQAMNAKQCRDGDIAGKFIDTVTLLGELAAQRTTLRFHFLLYCITTQFTLKEKSKSNERDEFRC